MTTTGSEEKKVQFCRHQHIKSVNTDDPLITRKLANAINRTHKFKKVAAVQTLDAIIFTDMECELTELCGFIADAHFCGPNLDAEKKSSRR